MAPPTYSPEDSELVADLWKISKASPKLIKSSTYAAPAEPNIIVRSWKMNEFKYYDIPSPFPTLARGLFTINLPTSDTPKHRIVARGYDKFFNINEVPWTSWSSLEANTCSPYVITLKSNGCIIFIAALTPSQLLITSKHSLGPIAGWPLSHAQAGEQWLRKYLAEKCATEEQLASELWQNNWTAIAELCDDSFEEHVLGYPPDRTGLHLHGLNESTRAFRTLPQADVDAFANKWGFIKTQSLTFESVHEVKAFTDAVGETGTWNGEAVEGFVVRTHVVERAADHSVDDRSKHSVPPYPPGSTLFFKVKFDEPYMMYRDWREITKQLLSTGGLGKANLSASRMKRPETRLYVKWVIDEISKNRQQFKGYIKGKGIISTREKFLEWFESREGREESAKHDSGVVDIHGQNEDGTVFGKTIIVPIAVPGCGKTAVSLALAHIFGFGHTQSDDVHAKKAGAVFLKNIVDLLIEREVVIADRNNHLHQHRQALRDATAKMYPPVRLFALNWSLENLPPATAHRICTDRVIRRGDNHQTLRADKNERKHEDVIWTFLQTSEGLAESEVDAYVDMDVTEDLEHAVNRAVEACVNVLGVPRPSPEKIQEGLTHAEGYAVTTKKKDGKARGKPSTPRYFGFLPEVDLQDLIQKRFELGDISDESRSFWKRMKANSRVQKRPHVTIVHQKSLPQESELWDQCMRLDRLPSLPLFKMKLGDIIWTDRVMAMTVDWLEADGDDAREFISTLPFAVANRLHITVATRDSKVQAVEGKALVEAWRSGRADPNVYSAKLDGVVVCGRLSPLFG